MNVHGIVWAGVRTDRFAQTAAFFRDVVALPVHEFRDDFAWYTLPDKSQFEIFGPAEPNHDHFVTGPVPSFHVDDVYGAIDELRQHGVQTFGPWGQPDAGWAHFRAADGNIYGLSAGAEYRR